MLHHAVDVLLPEELGQGPPPRWRIWVNFQAGPFHVEVKLLSQLFDDALADVAEGSYVIGENADVD